MNETELERMVVRLVGDGSSYQAMLRTAVQETKRVANEIDTAVKKIEGFQGSLERVGNKIRDIGSSLATTGKQMSLAVTAPLAAAGAFIVKAGADWESGFAGVRKTVNATESELQGLDQEFRKLTSSMPVAADQLLAIGEAAGQLGIKNQNIVSFTETIAKLAVTTNLGAEEGASTLAKFANITGMAQSKFSNLGSAIVALGNDGASTERDITNMAMRLAGAGTTVGLTIPQILGISSALSSLGLEAEAGGTAFSKLFLDMSMAVSAGGKDLATFASTAQMSIGDFKKLFQEDAGAAVEALLKGLSEMNNEAKPIALKEMGVEGTRMIDAMLRASNGVGVLTDSLKTAKRAFEENTALSKEAEERFKTFWSQVTLVTNNLKLLATEGFEAVKPQLVAVRDLMKDGVAWVRSLSEEEKRLGIQIGAVVAAIGPFLVGFSLFSTVIGQAVKGFSALWSIASKLSILKSVVQYFIDLRSSINALPWTNTRVQAQATSGQIALLGVSAQTTAKTSQASFVQVGTASTAMAATVRASAATASASLLGLQQQMLTTAQVAMAMRSASAGGAIAGRIGGTVAKGFTAPTVDADFTVMTRTIGSVAGASSIGSRAIEGLKGALAKAGQVANMFKAELVLLTAYLSYELGSAIGNAVFGINAYNEAVAKSITLNERMLTLQGRRDQIDMANLGAIEDPTARMKAVEQALFMARKEVGGYAASLAGAKKNVQDFIDKNTLMDGSMSLVARNSKVFEVLKDEVKEVEGAMARAEERVHGLELMKIGMGGGEVEKAAAAVKGYVGTVGDWTEEQKKLQEEVEKLEQKLQVEIQSIGKTAEQADVLALAMKGATKSQLEYAEALAADLKRGKEAEELRKDVDELTTSLKGQVDTFGMVGGALDLYKLKMRGATEEQLKAAKASHDQLTALEKQKDLMEKGKEVTKQFATPMQKYADRVKELDELLNAGAINQSTYTNAVKDAQKQLEKVAQVSKFDAAGYGTADAAQRVMEYLNNNSTKVATNAVNKINMAKVQTKGFENFRTDFDGVPGFDTQAGEIAQREANKADIVSSEIAMEMKSNKEKGFEAQDKGIAERDDAMFKSIDDSLKRLVTLTEIEVKKDPIEITEAGFDD